MTERTIAVNALARVEGEGAFHLKIREGRIADVTFRIFEPPRYFEALLRGRDARDAPDITSRICGICPIAYIMSASQAVEAALGIEVSPEIEALRRMIYCGEWIQSHVLHCAMLHAPDFLGLHSALEIAAADPELVRNALRLKKLGNSIMEAVGGRAVHPVNTRVGGFWSAPAPDKIAALIPELEWGAATARDLALAFARFDFPQDEGDYTFVSLGGADRYPILGDRIVSSDGLAITAAEWPDHFHEDHMPQSTALHGRRRDGRRYMVGPLARYANNSGHLPDSCRETAEAAGLGPVERNPFKSILVRMVEVQFACEEALALARAYVAPDPASAPFTPRAGTGAAATEAPRGICWHRYELDEEARILSALIVPPTSQNQPQIEADLARILAPEIDRDDDALERLGAFAIRNYDPCISCSTHAIRMVVDRG